MPAAELVVLQWGRVGQVPKRPATLFTRERGTQDRISQILENSEWFRETETDISLTLLFSVCLQLLTSKIRTVIDSL